MNNPLFCDGQKGPDPFCHLGGCMENKLQLIKEDFKEKIKQKINEAKVFVKPFICIVIIFAIAITAIIRANIYYIDDAQRAGILKESDFPKELKETLGCTVRERLNTIIRKLNTLRERQNDIIEKISKIDERIEMIGNDQHGIADVVDRAARQYQEEISSLFTYSGETNGGN